MADTDPSPMYTDEQMQSDEVSKKDIATFLQEHASGQFLMGHKLKGALKNVVKTATKDKLIADYHAMFEAKAFKQEGEENLAAGDQRVKEVTEKTKKLTVKDKGPVKYHKATTKNGDKVNFPKKGDMVVCFYKGTLDNGKVFDTNMESKKRGQKPIPLSFKVGVGNVIRGWDEALQTMSVGEKAEIVIEPEWAYGKKGVDGKVPPNSRLTFDVELVRID